jgi:SdrD B-like domain
MAAAVVASAVLAGSGAVLTHVAGAKVRAQAPFAAMGDFVWEDVNGNGLQDAGEQGIDGITIKLVNPADASQEFAITKTGANPAVPGSKGFYQFATVNPSAAPGGVFKIIVGDSSDYFPHHSLYGRALSPSKKGTDDHDSDAVQTPYSFVTIDNVRLGTTSAANLDVGFAPASSIGDRIWNDANANGLQDSGEAGVNGVVVSLYDTSNNLLFYTVSGNDPTDGTPGHYDFDALKPHTNYRLVIDASNFKPVPDPRTGAVGPLVGKTLSAHVVGDAALDSDAVIVSALAIVNVSTKDAYTYDTSYDIGIVAGTSPTLGAVPAPTGTAAPTVPATQTTASKGVASRPGVTVGGPKSSHPKKLALRPKSSKK